MKRILFLFILGILFGASSCVEIIDDLTLNEDGSGTFKYTVNLSSSKVKLNFTWLWIVWTVKKFHPWTK